MMDKSFTDHHKTVERLENVHKSWTAHYHENFKSLSLIELNKKAGHSKFKFSTGISFAEKAKFGTKSLKAQYPS